MKAHLAKVSLALLSAVFLLGCQEQGSEPVGPEGPQFDKPVNGEHHHGDVVDPDLITLTLADGMVTTDLPVRVGQDSRKKLNVGNSDFVHKIQMKFTQPGTCVGIKGTKSGVLPNDKEIVELVAELTSSVTEGFFTMQIDKSGLTVNGSTTSESHLLLVEHDGTFAGPEGHTRIMLGNPFDNQVPPNTVKWTQDGDGQDVFTFTGPVVVWAHGVGGGGGEKSSRIIACPGVQPDPNKVVATVNR